MSLSRSRQEDNCTDYVVLMAVNNMRPYLILRQLNTSGIGYIIFVVTRDVAAKSTLSIPANEAIHSLAGPKNISAGILAECSLDLRMPSNETIPGSRLQNCRSSFFLTSRVLVFLCKFDSISCFSLRTSGSVALAHT